MKFTRPQIAKSVCAPWPTVGCLGPVVRVAGTEEVAEEDDEGEEPQDLAVLRDFVLVVLDLVHVVQAFPCLQ